MFLALIVAAGITAQQKPPSDRMQAAIKRSFAKTMKDPDSVIYRWPAWRRDRDSTVYCFWANAKNSYGGYTGYKLYALMLSVVDDELRDVTLVGQDETDDPLLAAKFCANFGYDISGPPA